MKITANQLISSGDIFSLAASYPVLVRLETAWRAPQIFDSSTRKISDLTTPVRWLIGETTFGRMPPKFDLSDSTTASSAPGTIIYAFVKPRFMNE
jgi:hypothetical protein